MALKPPTRQRVPRRVHAVAVRDLPVDGHERKTHHWVANKVATLMGASYAGFDAGAVHPEAYFVPDDTLDAAAAMRLGISTSDQLLGGVVPFAFLATKAITHSRVDGARAGIAGWDDALASAVSAHTLPGFTAFCAADARQAHAWLARTGGVRLKLPTGVGGQGQWLLEDATMLDVLLAALPADYLARWGVVLETHLERLRTFSVGEVECAGLSIAYHGTQVTTRDRDGHHVYGGSDLQIRRGTLDALLDEALPPLCRQAVQAARAFDRLLRARWPRLQLSRRNYDVACGEDARGRPLCGVLEQSWRIGGATPAELAAIEMFARDRHVHRVLASTRELHGQPAPPGAKVYYAGDDPSVGPLVKFLSVAPC